MISSSLKVTLNGVLIRLEYCPSDFQDSVDGDDDGKEREEKVVSLNLGISKILYTGDHNRTQTGWCIVFSSCFNISI